MKFLICISIALFSLTVSGQTVLLMHDVRADKDVEFGPGKKNWFGSYTSLGFVAGPAENDSIRVIYGRSFQFGMGSFYRYQIARFLAVGYNSTFNFRKFEIEQKNPKVFAGPQLNKWERFYNIDFKLAPFMRFNFTKRGNHPGAYIDLGGYGSYNFLTRHAYRADLNNNQAQESVKIVSRGLQYINRFEYGFEARIAVKNFIFFGQYRYSNLFREYNNYTYPELPRLIFGLAFSG